MPTYEFRCPNGHDFERFFGRISEAPSEVACPECAEIATRRISGGAGLIFKGSGFYITDYAKKSAPEGGSGGSKGKSDGGKSDSTSESKTDAKSETKSDSATPKESSAKSDAPAASTSTPSTTATSAKKD